MIESREVNIGGIVIGGGSPIAVQTMCNTHTNDIESTVRQCESMYRAGADIIRITVPGQSDVESIKQIRSILRAEGINTPLVADIHFSSRLAIEVAPFVEKVRINPGNFHSDHNMAVSQFEELIKVCRQYGTAIRIGLNHGSLGRYITDLYGNTPLAMAKAAMDWAEVCIKNNFFQIVLSLKASNTIVMVQAYRLLNEMMKKRGYVFPLHLGVTEAGNGDSGRIKSCVGISALLSEGIGDTLRVSLTEDPVNEISVGKYLADRYDGKLKSSLKSFSIDGKKASAVYEASSKERVLLDYSCDFGKRLLDNELDSVSLTSGFGEDFDRYLEDELLQAARRRFYKPEYIACPGCGRTMYDLQKAFEEVKAKTSHLTDVVIAVMGCVVNGPGELADADWGYVGEGNHMVSIYHDGQPVLRHVPDTEAADRLLELIEEDKATK